MFGGLMTFLTNQGLSIVNLSDVGFYYCVLLCKPPGTGFLERRPRHCLYKYIMACCVLFLDSQVLGVIFMVLLQSLAVEMKNAPYSTCTVTQGGTLDWSSECHLLHYKLTFQPVLVTES